MSNKFCVVSEYNPSGDQPLAIEKLCSGVLDSKKDQVLLGVTGSGKTFTMAHVIANLNKPALIMAHNKTLTTQIYEEMKMFFPNNAVECFMSYYDYYQPEAYLPLTDTYIEKDASINQRIECLRHSATISLLERQDVLVVASVSAIYGLGDKESYASTILRLRVGDNIGISYLQRKLVDLQYERNDIELNRGEFQVCGDIINIFPSGMVQYCVRISFFGNEIEEIMSFNPISGDNIENLRRINLFPTTHYVASTDAIKLAVEQIQEELEDRVRYFYDNGQLIEANRLEKRTKFDIEMMLSTGSCKGIENYSRYFARRIEGEAPPTLFDYFPKDAILFIDESHVTVPQIRAMYNGDRARKKVLIEHGFRLLSAFDNRPMKFDEWVASKPKTIYVSATPGDFELKLTNNEVAEQLVRPTWIVEPKCYVRNVATQVDDLLNECKKVSCSGLRTLVTTLTKKMAENLSEFMQEVGLKSIYMHSDINVVDRTAIIKDLRVGTYDVLIGVNLLREGLDIPECGLVAILDADKEGFLRSRTSLIQTIGRAARNVESYVILYADKMTDSIRYALSEIDRRRNKQINYNERNGTIPKTVKRSIQDTFFLDKNVSTDSLEKLEEMMEEASSKLDFETAMKLRDKIKSLRKKSRVVKKK